MITLHYMNATVNQFITLLRARISLQQPGKILQKSYIRNSVWYTLQGSRISASYQIIENMITRNIKINVV